MKRALELTTILVLATLVAATILEDRPDARQRAANASEVPIVTEWIANVPNPDGTKSPFIMTIVNGPLGAVTVYCDLPDENILGMRSTAAAFVEDRIHFRNELGRFEGVDFGDVMVVTRSETNINGESAADSKYLFEHVDGNAASRFLDDLRTGTMTP